MRGQFWATGDPGSSSGGLSGLIDRILSIFLGASDPEREKRRLLKEIEKQVKHQKYKYLKTKGAEALPGLAKLFYDMYKVIAPAQVLLQNAHSSGVLKTILIESTLTGEQLKILETVDEAAIRKAAESKDTKVLASELKDKLVTFFSAFNGDKIKEINNRYNLLLLFFQLINFDYYFFLKKFDSALPERDFVYHPKFETINGSYISDDLKDFLEIMLQFNKDQNWNALFDILASYKQTEVINRDDFRKVIKNLLDVQRSSILTLIVQLIDQDPYYQPKSYYHDEHIVEEYLNKIKTGTEMTIQKILIERQNKKIDTLLNTIFGTTAISRMKYYTEKNNMAFSKKMLGGYIYVRPLNYLKAFLLDFYKRDIKTVVDILLIRGKWSTNLSSQQLSEAFHAIMQVSEDLIVFDEGLSEEGGSGVKLKAFLHKGDRDKNSIVILRKMLKDINDEALRMINETASNLIMVGKSLKLVLEDYEKKPHELILNWKEVEGAFEHDVKETLTGLYKKIYYFIQLMQFYVKKK
ncbi:DUF5312 family protein [Sediminispirochaeta bajacaliforniensis]|jgi:hypothetical protein|uniref:DUF5312 family protein n=1 Tax=Sediminispirochaeta bajacaliforniensis TaxID=148 RepID=UPI00035D80AD|nr:DUF5312 family protein [Sediminispirochaeta bajacaliforniensis]